MHVDDAMRPEVLVAYEMNGEPLNLYHGAPVRLIVPGWYGVANVKWMDQIHVQDRRYMGRFMARDYVTLSRRDIGGVERWEERSVTRMQLKSSVIRVTRRDQEHVVTGFVLNDGTPLRSVEVRIDDGPWQAADIDPESSQYSWKLFRYAWSGAAPGEHRVVSRVTDVSGQVQATADQMPEKPSRWENYAQFPRTVMIS
jgi:DMSO/TMAO reductase YedYZ molybdopterin-dependent catalytic subunit